MGWLFSNAKLCKVVNVFLIRQSPNVIKNALRGYFVKFVVIHSLEKLNLVHFNNSFAFNCGETNFQFQLLLRQGLIITNELFDSMREID